MDKYTKYLNELEELLHLTEEKKEIKKTLIDEKSKLLSEVDTNLEVSKNKVKKLVLKIKFLQNYKTELNKIRKTLFEEFMGTFIKFNVCVLIAAIIVLILPQLVFSLPVFLFAEAVILMGLAISYSQLYNDAIADIKKEYKNNNIEMLQDNIYNQYKKQKELTNQKESLENELLIFKNEVLDLDEIVIRIRETMNDITNSRTIAFNKLLANMNIEVQLNAMLEQDYGVNLLKEQVLKLVKKEEI